MVSWLQSGLGSKMGEIDSNPSGWLYAEYIG